MPNCENLYKLNVLLLSLTEPSNKIYWFKWAIIQGIHVYYSQVITNFVSQNIQNLLEAASYICKIKLTIPKEIANNEQVIFCLHPRPK